MPQSSFDYVGIGVLFFAFLSLVFAFLVLKNNYKRLNNILYSLVLLFICLWSMGLYFYSNPILFDAKTWLKIVYILSYVMVLSQGFFAYFFPEKKNIPYKPNAIAVGFLMIIGLYLLLFTDTVIINVFTSVENHISIATMGWGYFVYSIPIFMGMIFLASHMYRKSKLLTGIESSQLRMYLAGDLAMMVPVVIVDFIIPFLFGFTDWYRISPLFNIFYTVLVTYSMLKNRFFGLRSSVGKIIQFLLVSLFVFFVFYGLASFQINAFGTLFSPENYIFGAVIAPIFIYVFSRIKKKIDEVVENNIVFAVFNPTKIIQDYAKISSIELDLAKLSNTLLDVIHDSLHLQGIALILFKPESNKVYFSSEREFEIEDINTSFTKLLNEHPELELFTRNFFLSELSKDEHKVKRHYRELMKLMEKHKIALIIPLKNSYIVRGVLLLGSKDSESAFTVEEIEFLETLNNSASVAISRSVIHKQLEDLNSSLQQQVEAKTHALSDRVVEIEERHRKEEDMLNILGHELRTPLSIARNAIVMNLKKMESRIWDKDKIHEYTSMSYEHIDREIRNLETILSTTRIDNAKIQLMYENVDFLDVINDSLDGLTQRALAKGLKLKFKKPSESRIWVDRAKIQEIADNLIENSIKYTDKGFVQIEIVNHPEKKTADMIISDSGIGMSKADLRKLGTKFFRCNEYIGEGKYSIVRPGGTGLGLYVTFSLIKLMGGKYNVASELGKGSVFTVTMPAYDPKKHIQKAK